MSVQEAIITRIMEAGGKLTVKSALNPILWLSGIITVPSLVCFAIMSQPPNWLVILAFLPVVAAIFGFVFLLIFDRDKLQSENYQIRKLQMEMIEEKGRMPIEAEKFEITPDPETFLLLDKNTEE